MKYILNWTKGEYSDRSEHCATLETNNIKDFKEQLDKNVNEAFLTMPRNRGNAGTVVIHGYLIDLDDFIDHYCNEVVHYSIHEFNEWYNILEFKKENTDARPTQ